MKSAEDDLGYKPTIQNDLTEVVQWFRDRGHGKKKSQGYTVTQLVKDVLLGVIFAMLIMSFLPIVR